MLDLQEISGLLDRQALREALVPRGLPVLQQRQELQRTAVCKLPTMLLVLLSQSKTRITSSLVSIGLPLAIQVLRSIPMEL